jgi:hypothetical protein
VTLSLDKAATHFSSQTVTPLALSSERSQPSPETELIELRSRLLDDADQMLQDMLDELFPDSSLSPELEKSAFAPQYRLHLDEEILVAHTAKPIIISGEITTQQQPPHPQLRLHISLRDPRIGEIVAELSPRLRSERFPLTFCYSLTIPSRCESYLLEGEVTLCDKSTQDDQQQVLDTQAFTVSANWEKLEPMVVGVMSDSDFSHPPAPLSPLTAYDHSKNASSDLEKKPGVFPPKLSKTPKKKTPPKLPNLPNPSTQSAQTTPLKEYVWSKPDEATTGEWELIPELVIIATDETES